MAGRWSKAGCPRQVTCVSTLPLLLLKTLSGSFGCFGATMSVRPFCTVMGSPVLACQTLGPHPKHSRGTRVRRRKSLHATLLVPSRQLPSNVSGAAWRGQAALGVGRTRHVSIAFWNAQPLRISGRAHATAVEVLRVHRPEWVNSPLATREDVEDILTLVFQTRPHPKPPPPLADPCLFKGWPLLTFYTDGTCVHPSVPQARHSAWALVRDCSCTLAQRSGAISLWRREGVLPPSLCVVDRGFVGGLQSIQRAELTAALQAVSMGKAAGCVPTHVITDSAYVVHVFRQLLQGRFEVFIRRAANVDLLLALRAVWFPGVSVFQIKSHLDPCQAATPEQCWGILGNQQADRACQLAIQADLSVVHEMAAAVAQHTKVQHTQLQAVYAYLLALNTATCTRLNASSHAVAAPARDGRVPLDMQSPLWIAWKQARIARSPLADAPNPGWHVFLHSSWGAAFSWRVWQWLHTLEWRQGTDQGLPGITTLELFCNFVATTATLPPHPIPHSSDGVEYLPFDHPAAQLAPTPLRTWLQSLLAVTKQLSRLAHCYLLPPTASKKVEIYVAHIPIISTKGSSPTNHLTHRGTLWASWATARP